ncbi:WD40 repeat-like protein [Rhizopogon salebrosus TDB-379]|nr:WD40 repeat-like protein [Rhizopogon salebrosus TDB-379]
MDMASRSTRSTGTRKMIVGMTLVGHQRSFHYTSDGEQRENNWGPTIAYFPDGHKIISGSADKTTRLWDLQAGKEIEEARFVGEQKVDVVAVSSDGRWVVAVGGLGGVHKVKVNEVETGSVKIFEGHSGQITCIDICMDSKQLASGSWDGTLRIWSLDTGELVGGPFDSVDFPGAIGAVRFSHDSRKLAVRSQSYLEVWDIQAQKLDNKVGKRPGLIWFHVPVFWTTKDKTIVASFCFTDGNHDPAKTIYEFDSSTLETVGTPFEGHTHHVAGLALSNDFTLLASASLDGIKLWAFESRQFLASFDDTAVRHLVLSPDSRKLAYTTFNGSHKIYICDILPDILADIRPGQEALATSVPAGSHVGDSLNVWDPILSLYTTTYISPSLQSNATRRPATVCRNQVSPSFALLPPRPSPTIYPHQSTFIDHLRKLLPFSFGIDAVPHVQVDEPRDPLDRPVPCHIASASKRLYTRRNPV